MQRSVAKFTRQRSQILHGKSTPKEISEKQKDQLRKHFSTVIYHVFLPKTQCIAPPSWVAKHVKVSSNGKREVTCKKGRPQLFTLKFTPSKTRGVVDYLQGGKFHIGSENMPESEIRCVALNGDGNSAPQWRLETYDANDEDPAELDNDSENEEVDSFANATSAEEDVEIHEPEDHIVRAHDAGLQSGSDLEEENNEEEELWQGHQDGHDAADVQNDAAIVRPKLKRETKEWMILKDEGWMDKLPKVSGTTLSHHQHIQAWSTRYPLNEAVRHFARHYSETRTAMSALLQCMEWMVLQHYEKTGEEKAAALHQQLQARRQLEDYTCTTILQIERKNIFNGSWATRTCPPHLVAGGSRMSLCPNGRDGNVEAWLLHL